MSKIAITRLDRVAPPLFSATYDGKPLTIKLDTSAVLKLEGAESFEDFPNKLPHMTDQVRRAAERLIAMRHAGVADNSTVIISALDLE